MNNTLQIGEIKDIEIKIDTQRRCTDTNSLPKSYLKTKGPKIKLL